MQIEQNTPMLSTGQLSTVGNWIGLAKIVFGEESKQIKFLQSKITEKNGLDEPIITDEGQVIFLLVNLPDDWK